MKSNQRFLNHHTRLFFKKAKSRFALIEINESTVYLLGSLEQISKSSLLSILVTQHFGGKKSQENSSQTFILCSPRLFCLFSVCTIGKICCIITMNCLSQSQLGEIIFEVKPLLLTSYSSQIVPHTVVKHYCVWYDIT